MEEEDNGERGSPQDAAFQRALRPGQRLDVQDTMNAWLPAVIYVAEPDRVFVHYIGWVHHWNEWIHRASPRLAPRGRHCCACMAGRGPGEGSAQLTRLPHTHTPCPVVAGALPRVGQQVEVLDEERYAWVSASIIAKREVNQMRHVRIHFARQPASKDIWLHEASERIAPWGAHRVDPPPPGQRRHTTMSYWNTHDRQRHVKLSRSGAVRAHARARTHACCCPTATPTLGREDGGPLCLPALHLHKCAQ